MRLGYEVGDIVEHNYTHLRARVQKVLNRLDGTQDLMVFTDVLWNSSKVKLVEESDVECVFVKLRRDPLLDDVLTRKRRR